MPFPSRVVKPQRIRAALARVAELVREFYDVRHRGALARLRREEDDLFMLLVFSETMGIPNPASYHTLELMPLLYERFHEWHTRMGMERSPLEGFRCC
jgi:hypothetical protein